MNDAAQFCVDLSQRGYNKFAAVAFVFDKLMKNPVFNSDGFSVLFSSFALTVGPSYYSQNEAIELEKILSVGDNRILLQELDYNLQIFIGSNDLTELYIISDACLFTKVTKFNTLMYPYFRTFMLLRASLLFSDWYNSKFLAS